MFRMHCSSFAYEIFIDLLRFLLCEPARASSALDSPSLPETDACSSSAFCVFVCGILGVSSGCIGAANVSDGMVNGRHDRMNK